MKVLVPALPALVASIALALLAGCDGGSGGGAAAPDGAPPSPLPIRVSGSLSDTQPRQGIPTLEPILYLVNDSPDTVVVRHVGVPTAPLVVMEPRARFTAGLGGQFLGKPEDEAARREEIRKSDGILLSVSDEAGVERGRILFSPTYLFSGLLDWACLSRAAEPPLVVDSRKALENPSCRLQGAAR